MAQSQQDKTKTLTYEFVWITNRPTEVGWYFHKSPSGQIEREYVSARDLVANIQTDGHWLQGLWTAPIVFAERNEVRSTTERNNHGHGDGE